MSTYTRKSEQKFTLAGECALLLSDFDYLRKIKTEADFFENLEESLQKNKTRITPIEYDIIAINISGFEDYAALKGIRTVNQLWNETVQLLMKFFADDYVARFTDSTFFVLANRMYALEKLNLVYSSFRQSFDGEEVVFKAGIYHLSELDKDMHQACDNAQIACGKPNPTRRYYTVYQAKFGNVYEKKQYVLENLEVAIERGELKVFFQPLFRSLTGQLCSLEALARWHHPQLGILTPQDFIPLLEENRKIYILDLFMIEQVCQFVRKRIDAHEPVVMVSLNLSRVDFFSCDILGFVNEMVIKYNIPRKLLHIALSETLSAHEPELLVRDFARYRNAGVEKLQEAGAVYATPDVLQQFEFNALKLDIRSLADFDDRTKNVLRSVVQMAKHLGVESLAAGVERQEEYEFLRAIGCEKLQGFYFSKPLPYEELEQLMQERELEYEDQEWRELYEAGSAINIDCDKNAGIIEDDGKNFKVWQLNEGYVKVLNEVGTTTLEQAESNLNNRIYPYAALFRRAADLLITVNEPYTFNYGVGDYLMKMTMTAIVKHKHRRILIFEISREKTLQEQNQYRDNQAILDAVFLRYKSIQRLDLLNYYAVDLGKDGAYAGKAISQDKREFIAAFDYYIEENIHPEDQARFKKFFKLETMLRRVAEAEDGSLASYFRGLQDNGKYRWQLHTLVPATRHEGSVIYSVRNLPVNDDKTMKELVKRLPTF